MARKRMATEARLMKSTQQAQKMYRHTILQVGLFQYYLNAGRKENLVTKCYHRG